jgi:hypothetical protein
MIKLTFLREEDYWIFPLSIISVVALAFMIYSSIFSQRLPAAVIGLGLLWFTTVKIKEGYSSKRAKLHFGLTLLCSGLFLLLAYILTN